MALDYKGRNDIGNWTCINYLQYVQSSLGLRTPSLLERATQPYSLGGGRTIWPGSRPAGGYHV